MQRHISDAEVTPIRFVLLTLDHHIAGAIERARQQLVAELPGLDLRMHAAASFSDPAAAEACRQDIAQADIVFANMLFLEEHIKAVLPALQARRAQCDAMVCAMSAGEVMRQTRMGSFSMDGSSRGPMALLKKLRGKAAQGSAKDGGAGQLAMLRLLPKLLRVIPGKAQELRVYFLTLAYWLSGSSENIADLVRLLVNSYADGPRRSLRGTLKPQAPRVYPETGVYHPRLPGRLSEDASLLSLLPRPAASSGTVGLLLMRSYLLSGDCAHYDGVIERLEARGLRVIPAFASGLDARAAIEKYFTHGGEACVDAVVSLTGFSLVGGPAFNDARAAEETLAKLDVPYLAAQPLEFQSIEQWQEGARGLTALESTIMIAIPELDGATGPIVFAGRRRHAAEGGGSEMAAIDERVEMLAARIHRQIVNRQTPRAQRNVAIVLFNFPPNAGATGTAAYLSVFQSLLNTLRALAEDGYTVDVPDNVEALRERVLGGNAARFGTDANVHARISVAEHIRKERYLAEIERQWGPAPGKQQSDGTAIFVLGAQLGRVFVGIQPAFGFEGDPMRLLFEAGFAPTHAFNAFYRYLRDDFRAHSVLHFGTHGALEFMPGKQAGMSAACWSDRLIGDLPNIYLYASNNPSEGALAKRRAAATLVSYLTPPVTQAGLYRGLLSLRQSLDHLRALAPGEGDLERARLLPLIQAQAAELELAAAEPAWEWPGKQSAGLAAADVTAQPNAERELHALHCRIAEVEATLIPCGLHVVGESMPAAARCEYLCAIAEGSPLTAAVGEPVVRAAIEALILGDDVTAAMAGAGIPEDETSVALCNELARTNQFLSEDHELPALLRALDGRFIRPAPGGDLLRNPAVLPTGRNLHGFDPFAIPSAFAIHDGAEQAALLLARHVAEGNALPEAVALVLWGADNLKSGGGPICQALALLGARPRFDSYGRLCGAELIPLAELGRPRVDVLITLSGIFRDLLPLQIRLLAEAAFLAAAASDEPLEQNFVRRHTLAHQKQRGCDFETAALRVFSNCDGAYGSNVNQMIESSTWQDEDELGASYMRRKCFAYGRSGVPVRQEELLSSLLRDVELAYQNLESVELGVTSLDQYFDTLGGIGRAAQRAKGSATPLPVYIGDQTRGDGNTQAKVRTLREQVSLESRSRSLNPKWAEGLLEHGAEGVRQIEAQVTNTLGWSATTQQVDPWVYRELTQTYVLDAAMRERLATLNPKASLKLTNRLIEAHERNYWQPDADMLAQLRAASEQLEDRLEGVGVPLLHTQVA